ncbi:MAG: carboxypeptidase regulatory-like domain-containing protein [Acidobacteria bacterium]|nr:carboxypeptidase regulatory-like domain-containing protein [Acidobacteriota bacterium]
MRLISRICLVLLVTVLATAAWAGETGSVSGFVKDGSGLAVPGATVKITGAQAPYTTVSNANGAFKFGVLLPGDYVVSADLKGLGSAKQSVKVFVDNDAQVTLTLVSAAKAEVVVTGSIAEIDKKSSESQLQLHRQHPQGPPALADLPGRHQDHPRRRHRHERNRLRLHVRRHAPGQQVPPRRRQRDEPGLRRPRRRHEPARHRGLQRQEGRHHGRVRPDVGRDDQRRHEVGNEPDRGLRPGELLAVRFPGEPAVRHPVRHGPHQRPGERRVPDHQGHAVRLRLRRLLRRQDHRPVGHARRRHDDAARLEVAQRRLLREADLLRRPVPSRQRRLPRSPGEVHRPVQLDLRPGDRRSGRRHDELHRQPLGRLVPVEEHDRRGEGRLPRGERHLGGADGARAVPARRHQPQEPRRVRRVRRPGPQRRQRGRARVRRDRGEVQAHRTQGRAHAVLRRGLEPARVQARRRLRSGRERHRARDERMGHLGHRPDVPGVGVRHVRVRHGSRPVLHVPARPVLAGADVLGVPPGHDLDEEPHDLPRRSRQQGRLRPALQGRQRVRTDRDARAHGRHAVQLHDVRLEPADPAAPRHHLEPEPAFQRQVLRHVRPVRGPRSEVHGSLVRSLPHPSGPGLLQRDDGRLPRFAVPRLVRRQGHPARPQAPVQRRVLGRLLRGRDEGPHLRRLLPVPQPEERLRRRADRREQLLRLLPGEELLQRAPYVRRPHPRHPEAVRELLVRGHEHHVQQALRQLGRGLHDRRLQHVFVHGGRAGLEQRRPEPVRPSRTGPPDHLQADGLVRPAARLRRRRLPPRPERNPVGGPWRHPVDDVRPLPRAGRHEPPPDVDDRRPAPRLQPEVRGQHGRPHRGARRERLRHADGHQRQLDQVQRRVRGRQPSREPRLAADQPAERELRQRDQLGVAPPVHGHRAPRLLERASQPGFPRRPGGNAGPFHFIRSSAARRARAFS